ncbi:MAG TPA: hypothetical protein VG842_01785 [Sediminibacterium sp.]|nr:hypothetical protein [Sediminibacterium sp.]
MRLIDRLYSYLQEKQISAYAFERSCGVSNGYLSKQLKGKGAVGSDILEKIKQGYPDLSIVWLVTGKGSMQINRTGADHYLLLQQEVQEEQQIYHTGEHVLIHHLQKEIAQLESMIADKDRIIRLLEEMTQRKSSR